jgi:hypothetical protein
LGQRILTMIKIKDLLKEVIDIYSPEELEAKEISYDTKEESPNRFRVQLRYKDQYYELAILPTYNPKCPSIHFGSTDENYNNLNLSELLNSPYSSRILAAIFGLIRYWVNKHNVTCFDYSVEGKVRTKLYNYYFNKHFPDFESTTELDGSLPIQTWRKV